MIQLWTLSTNGDTELGRQKHYLSGEHRLSRKIRNRIGTQVLDLMSITVSIAMMQRNILLKYCQFTHSNTVFVTFRKVSKKKVDL